MTTVMKPVKQGYEVSSAPQISKIRVTLHSHNVKNLERVSSELIQEAINGSIKFKGPVRLPTKVLRITTRKSPCGEGTNTWDRFQMRIHKRIIDLYSSQDVVRALTTIKVEPTVHIEVTIEDYPSK